MSENKLNVVIPKDYNGTPIEVVLREGEAACQLEPKEPEKNRHSWYNRIALKMVGKANWACQSEIS
jgi:hypothetical protein